LAGVNGLTLNVEPPGTKNSYWMVTAIWDAAYRITKESLMATLSQDGIDTRPFFYPLSSLPAYAATPDAPRAKRENRVAYDLSPRGINLPSGLSLTATDVSRVCKALKAALAR
jgi:perosamine synthetase